MTPFIGEIVGTAILILLGCGVNANVSLSKTAGNESGWIVITFGWGLAVFTAVFIVGQFSGAHLNPAVTVGLAAAGKFPWDQVAPYMAAQFLGAFIGAFLVWLTHIDHFNATKDKGTKLGVFSTNAAIKNPVINLITEAIGTFVLVFGALYLAAPSIAGPEGQVGGLGALDALPIGLLVFAIGMSLGGPTGYAINPARDLGPRIMHAVLPIQNKGGSNWSYAWIPVVGPILGGFGAAALALALGGMA
ncbi:MAG: MIP/aquaporin family protein [Bacteroidota bacterium]